MQNQILENYLAAFEAANGKSFTGRLNYESGWFVFRNEFDEFGNILARYRKSTLVQMTERLLVRAKESKCA